MRNKIIGVSLLAVIGVGLCSGIAWGGVSADTTVNASTAFSLSLYRQLKGEPGNLFFSPLSVRTAMEMACLGARGQTAQELESALYLPRMESRIRQPEISGAGFQLHTANVFWKSQSLPLVKKYSQLIRDRLNAEVNEVDFGNPTRARATLNQWVGRKTNGKITDLIPDGFLSKSSLSVLINAVYFKAAWVEKFSKHATQDAVFEAAPQKAMNVRMMSQQDRFGYVEDADVQVLQMWYRGGSVGMVVVLPKSKYGFAALEASLTPKLLHSWLSKLESREVKVFFPRFKTSWGGAVDSALRALGVSAAFDSKLADFSGITGNRDLSISGVLHRAFIEVNEEGTEAAAATAVGMVGAAMPGEEQKPVEFRADHPFLYLIRERNTGEILFMGRLVEP